jgi:predicted nucleic acid-binding protein
MSDAADRFFFDTNVLIYWVDAAQRSKHLAAREWVAAVWENRCGAISWQVLNEFYANATRKLRVPQSGARQLVEEYSLWHPAPIDLALLRRAWYWSDKAGVPYWDSLILAAAEIGGCRYLLSEDFQAGQKFGELTVVNPFLSGPAEFDLG